MSPLPTIKAESLMQALRDGQELLDEPCSGRRTEQGVEFRVIEDDVDLDAISYPHKLAIRYASFKGRLNLREARFDGTVDLSSCVFERGITLEGARLGGNLILDDAKVYSMGNFSQVQVQGNLLARLIKVGKSSTGEGGDVQLKGAKVTGYVDFRGAYIQNDLNLQTAELGASFFCSPYEPAKKGDQVIWLHPKIGGKVWLRGAKVADQVVFAGANLEGDLDLQNAHIGHGLFCRPPSEREPQTIQHITIDGTAANRHTTVGGRTSLNGATVGYLVDFSSADLRQGLDLQSAALGGSFFCTVEEGHPRPRIGALRNWPGGKKVAVWLNGAKVAGPVHFLGADIQGDLHLDSADLGMNLFCKPQGTDPSSGKIHRTVIEGDAWLRGTKVAGQVELSGTQIKGKLILEAAEIGGELFCKSSEGYSTEIGQSVNLRAARIRAAEIEWSCLPKELDLSTAQFTKLELQGTPPPRITIDAEGLHFQQLRLRDTKYILSILKSTCPFRKGTYQYLENWLRNGGEDELARDVYQEMRRRERKEGHMSRLARLGDAFLDWSVGYGFATYRLFYYFVPAVLLCCLLFASPKGMKRSVEPRASASTAAAPTAWDVFWLSVQTNLAVVPLGAAKDWTPSEEVVTLGNYSFFHMRYIDCATVFSLASYVTVPLFIAGLSGLLKKEK
jgi:uncharacterized protein YjbI with pentapeptide repeats